MGGEIGLETGSGGTIFWIELPVTQRGERDGATREADAPATAGPGASTLLY
jgi:hypothetical protein